MRLNKEFVIQVPREMEEKTLYISMEFGTAMHKCFCGCGNDVITPLKSTGWTLTFNGKVTLYPSIGNWSFPCQSHYWIQEDQVKFVGSWNSEEIRSGRERDLKKKEDFYQNIEIEETPEIKPIPSEKPWFIKLLSFFRRSK